MGSQKKDGKRNKAFSLVKKLKIPMIQINMSNSRHIKGKLKKAGR